MKDVLLFGMELAGGGKSAGKGKSATWPNAQQRNNAAPAKPVDDAAAKAARTCTWADCRAAKNKTATWGAGTSCFACKRAFAAKPPVELMADWAFAAAVEEKKAQPPPKGGGKGKNGGKG